MRILRIVPRTVRKRIKDSIRRYRIRRALRPLRTRGALTPVELAAFRRAWGNEGFSADAAYLAQLLKLLTSGPVLECGTGGTTLLANEVGRRRGFSTYSLEQNPEWGELAGQGLQAVSVIYAPLRDYGSYCWYDVRCDLPQHFALIICDGPYIDPGLGEPHSSAWRYGLLPWLKNSDRTFEVLLLDHANDPRAPAVLDRWQREFGVGVRRLASPEGELAIVTPQAADPSRR